MSWGFYGRTEELRLTAEILGRERWFFVKMTGRRRIGKTTLIQQALRRTGQKPVFYVQIPDSGPAGVLSAVADAMAAAGGGSLVERKLNRADHVDELLGQLRAQQTAFLAVGVLALIISALGILNIGLASVGERARELVIRRAIGATRAGLMGQMLVASVVIGLVAAALACGLAVLGVEWWVPRRVDPMTAIRPPTLPWTAATWGLVAATTTTLLGSLIPAVVAARLDVASALRD